MEIWGGTGILATVIVLGYLSVVRISSKRRFSRTTPLDQLDKAIFGQMPDGTEISEYTLRNRTGITAKVISYGATLRELWIPDHRGRLADVVLGFDRLRGYLAKHPFFGGTIGRYANRIAKGRFTLNGQEFQLAINDPPNALHGGLVGFDRRVWKGETIESAEGACVRFTYVSEDGEENFPGTVTASVTYTLTDENELKLVYTAGTDKPTPVNLTNHSYFNLAGSGDILQHVLYLNANAFTPVDSQLIPTGELRNLADGPLDFRKPTAIGARIEELKETEGYDHNFVVEGEPGTLRLAAKLTDPRSGRQMEVWTTEPALQFYAGGKLDGSVTGKGGVVCRKYAALCLETQHFPDSPNHPNFPSTILLPQSPFRSETIYKFSAKSTRRRRALPDELKSHSD